MPQAMPPQWSYQYALPGQGAQSDSAGVSAYHPQYGYYGQPAMYAHGLYPGGQTMYPPPPLHPHAHAHPLQPAPPSHPHNLHNSDPRLAGDGSNVQASGQ